MNGRHWIIAALAGLAGLGLTGAPLLAATNAPDPVGMTPSAAAASTMPGMAALPPGTPVLHTPFLTPPPGGKPLPVASPDTMKKLLPAPGPLMQMPPSGPPVSMPPPGPLVTPPMMAK